MDGTFKEYRGGFNYDEYRRNNRDEGRGGYGGGM
jgi:hypothetical protein